MFSSSVEVENFLLIIKETQVSFRWNNQDCIFTKFLLTGQQLNSNLYSRKQASNESDLNKTSHISRRKERIEKLKLKIAVIVDYH